MLILVLNSLLFLSPLGLSWAQSGVDTRVNCHPDPGDPSQAACEARGCIYGQLEPQGRVPWCYYPTDYGYLIDGAAQQTTLGYTLDLVKSGPPSFAPDEFSEVQFEVEFHTDTRLRLKLSPKVPRYEVPLEDLDPVTVKPTHTLYDVEILTDPVFAFRVIRKDTAQILYDSTLGGLTLADQYLQVAGKLPDTASVYGFGENENRPMQHEMHWETLAMFATDRGPHGDATTYGTHPYYTAVEDDLGNTHSVLFLNSNPQEVQLTPAPGVVYRTLGGVLDMYFFLGPSPEQITEQFTRFVGRQALPAYWTLGFHLCRYGYNTLDNMTAAYQRTLDAGIPLEAQWGDIDTLDRRLVFTYDKVNFAGLPQFIDDLHASDRRYVTIVDPGVSNGEPSGTYPPFENGQALDVWVLDGSTGLPIEGKVWPDDPVQFPDFTNPVTWTWWSSTLLTWHDDIKYDGLWIDMNEPALFVDGSIHGCNMSDSRNSPPYTPHLGYYGGPTGELIEDTLCMDAQHLGGSHYDTHNMYGWWESRATQQAMYQVSGGERGLVLSRSTFVGSGYYATHWLGDNQSGWSDLRASIVGTITMGQFGIPHVGPDICGHNGITTVQLCLRWHQLGAFYPFSRNHNTRGTPDQDPGIWPDVAAAAKKALETRYTLLPYLYTLFYQHTTTGSTVARALWQEFPADLNVRNLTEQFLWGSGLLISPVVHFGDTSVNAYLPAASWYDFYSGQLMSLVGNEYVSVDCPLNGSIPLHVRGGTILATQTHAMTLTEARANPIGLLAALDILGTASGSLYWDDGISVDTAGAYALLDFHVMTGDVALFFTSAVENANYPVPPLTSLTFYGLTMAYTVVDVNGEPNICSIEQTGTTLHLNCKESPLDLLSPLEIILYP